MVVKGAGLMNKNIEEKYKIDTNIIKNYIDEVNAITLLNESDKKRKNSTSDNVKKMRDEIKKIIRKYPNDKAKIVIAVIKQIIEQNNGIISSKIIRQLGISRQYLSNLEKNREIERTSRGVYQALDSFEDSFYLFQIKYKKAIFSHMNALYFYGLTEEYPYNYSITIPNSYHSDTLNEKCNVFYVNDDIYDLGISEVISPNGNKLKAYDIERCICDIIKSKNRMDLEQVKKTIKLYMKSKNKDMNKLSEYSKKMGISKQVIEMVGMFNE